jgi:hypothetical protein
MTVEFIEYRGYELHIDPSSPELKVGIKKRGSFITHPKVSPDKAPREQLISEAKAVVDALIDPPHLKKEGR